MNYEIFGDTLPAVTLHLDAGESIYTQSGGMLWMTDGITMETNMKGGLLSGLGRRFLTGESLFQATYTANANGQAFTAGSSFPGSIVALDVSQGPYICQKNSFLCAQSSVTLQAYVLPGFKAGFFGGEGWVLQELSGQGLAFLEIDGFAKELDLAPGEKLKVDTGHVAAYEKSVKYSVERIKGFANILFGGEGLFLTTVEGPGKVWLQTMDITSFAAKLAPLMPGDKS